MQAFYGLAMNWKPLNALVTALLERGTVNVSAWPRSVGTQSSAFDLDLDPQKAYAPALPKGQPSASLNFLFTSTIPGSSQTGYFSSEIWRAPHTHTHSAGTAGTAVQEAISLWSDRLRLWLLLMLPLLVLKLT